MTGRVVVLTGASSGIGRAAAVTFARHGDRLVLAARDSADLQAAADECGGETLVVPADVTRHEQVDELAAAAVDRFGRIDVWVDTAAVMAYGRFEDLPPEVFERVVATDLLGPANVARSALRQFRRQQGGTLILTSSLLAHVTVPYIGAYVTAKWGLRGLTRTLRQETRDAPGIRICALAPGSVDTPIYTNAANYAGSVGRPPPPVDPAQRMADAIVKLAGKPRAEVSVGATNRIIELGFTTLPGVYDALVGPLMRRGGLSRTPVEPTKGNVFGSQPHVEGGPGRWGRWPLGLALGAGTAALAVAARLSFRPAAPTRT